MPFVARFQQADRAGEQPGPGLEGDGRQGGGDRHPRVLRQVRCLGHGEQSPSVDLGASKADLTYETAASAAGETVRARRIAATVKTAPISVQAMSRNTGPVMPGPPLTTARTAS